jgi:hypothetical protein
MSLNDDAIGVGRLHEEKRASREVSRWISLDTSLAPQALYRCRLSPRAPLTIRLNKKLESPAEPDWGRNVVPDLGRSGEDAGAEL